MNDNTLNNNYLASIFSIAERGMTEFSMPLANEGKFEVLMYGIWLGLRTLDRYGIPLNSNESDPAINNFLVQSFNRLGISPDKKAEKLFKHRAEEWERDTKSFISSNTSQTKQYIPEYLYLCFVDSPLTTYSSIELSKRIDQLDQSKLSDFGTAFESFYSGISYELKKFESDSQSYRSRANDILNKEITEENKGLYSDLEKRLILRFKNGNEKKELSLEDLMPPSIDLAMIDKLVAETAFSMSFLKTNPQINSMDRYSILFKELSDKSLDELKAEKNELIYVIKPMYEQGLETRKRCAAMIMALDDGPIDKRKGAVISGENLLNSIIKNIDAYIGTLDFVIDLKSGKYTNQERNDKKMSKSNSGCLSLFSLAFIIIGSCFYFLLNN